MDKSSTFSSLGQFLRANRTFFLVLLLLVVTVGGYLAWRSEFSFDYNRFFAAETATCADAGEYYPDQVCAEAAGSCTKRQQWQGKLFVDKDGNPSYCFQCPAGVLDVCGGPTPTPDETDVSTRYVDAFFTDNFGGAKIVNTTYQDQRPVTYCVFEMIGGDFNNQRLLTSKIFYVGALKSMNVNLSQVYSACGTRTLQLDLIRGEGCGEAPYHHAGFLFDAIISMSYNGGACTTQPPVTSQPPETSQPPTTSQPPYERPELEAVCTGGATPRITLRWPIEPPAGAPGEINPGNPAVINKGTGGQPAVQLNPPASASGSDWVWIDTDVESGQSYTYRAKYGPTADTTSVAITASPENCGGAPSTSQPPPEEVPLSCSPAQQNATVGESVSVNATGGTGTYSWSAPGGATVNASGTPLSVSYDTPGFKTVVVTSGGNQVACTIQVNLAAVSSPPPSAELVCTPAAQNVFSGQQVQIAGSGGTRPYSWSAPDGTPASGSDTTPFTVAFTNNQASASTFLVTLRDNTSEGSAVCRVSVSCAAPTCEEAPEGCSYTGSSACSCGTLVCPSGAPLVCSPSTRTLRVNQDGTWSVGGGTPPYTWTAPGSENTTDTGSSLVTSYDDDGGYLITVRDSLNASATCTVSVESSGGTTTPSLDIDKTVRNVTANSPERDSVEANPVQTVEFIVLVSARGNGTSRQVVMRDTLPAGLTYVVGSTTIDNAPAADGVTAGGLNLGDINPSRSITVRFRATVAQEAFFSPGTTVLTNTAFVRGSNVSEDSDEAYVRVARATANASLTLWKAGRNVTRNETGEHALVTASPNNTLEFFLHVRNTSASPLSNLVVRDALPTQVTYVAGSARMNGSPVADTLATSGANIGSLAPGAEVLVTFQGRVGAASLFSPGRTNLLNTVYARSDGVPELMAQLPLVVTLSLGPATEVETGPGDSAVLALAISAIITLLYVGYTGTEVYRRREVRGLAKDSHSDHDLFDFKR